MTKRPRSFFSILLLGVLFHNSVLSMHWNKGDANAVQRDVESDCIFIKDDETVVISDGFHISLNPIIGNSKSFGLTDQNGRIISLKLVNEKYIPLDIFHLKSLKRLEIENTCLSPTNCEQFPPEFQCLASSPIELIIKNTKMTFLTKQISQFQHLQILKLINTNLISLPDFIGNLTSLITLDLSNNNLQSLPITMNNLRSLEQIILSNNPSLHSIQPLNGLPSLRILNARDCSIKLLPRDLPQLTDLYMSNNHLTKLTGIETLGYASNGTNSFYFNHNRLRFISPRISRVKNLVHLHLHDNQLHTLPREICQISTLEYLSVQNNFFDDIQFKKNCDQYNSKH